MALREAPVPFFLAFIFLCSIEDNVDFWCGGSSSSSLGLICLIDSFSSFGLLIQKTKKQKKNFGKLGKGNIYIYIGDEFGWIQLIMSRT